MVKIINKILKVIVALILIVGILFVILNLFSKRNSDNDNGDIVSVPVRNDRATGLSITNFGISYPPINDQMQLNISKIHLQNLKVNIIRFSVHWKFIEKSKGKFGWQDFDKKMNWVQENNLLLLLTIEPDGPDFVCRKLRNENSCVYENNEDLKNFVRILLKRYPDQIAKIQFGNEMLSSSFYIGDEREYVLANNIVYETAKEVSPTIPVVLGGFSTGVLRRFAACEQDKKFPLYYKGKVLVASDVDELCEKNWVKEENDNVLYILKNADYDVVDIHLYDDVEYWDVLYNSIQAKVPGFPIIVSEFGGPIVYDCNSDLSSCKLGPTETENMYSDQYHASRVEEYMIVINDLEIREAYFFKLIESNLPNTIHAKSGLLSLKNTNENLELEEKPAYSVFKDFSQ